MHYLEYTLEYWGGRTHYCTSHTPRSSQQSVCCLHPIKTKEITQYLWEKSTWNVSVQLSNIYFEKKKSTGNVSVQLLNEHKNYIYKYVQGFYFFILSQLYHMGSRVNIFIRECKKYFTKMTMIVNITQAVQWSKQTPLQTHRTIEKSSLTTNGGKTSNEIIAWRPWCSRHIHTDSTQQLTDQSAGLTWSITAKPIHSCLTNIIYTHTPSKFKHKHNS